jgi:hypothetical protein
LFKKSELLGQAEQAQGQAKQVVDQAEQAQGQAKQVVDQAEQGHVFNIANYTIFGEPQTIAKLRELTANSTTLHNLDCKVSVGPVVWNQNKSILTDDETQTRLIYSSDICDGALSFKTYKNEAKKNFIRKKGNTHPLLVINRGYGVGDYKFDYCLIDGTFEYLVENHLICIICSESMTAEQQIALYKQIILSLTSIKTREFIGLYFGNGAINTAELNHILPIYI